MPNWCENVVKVEGENVELFLDSILKKKEVVEECNNPYEMSFQQVAPLASETYEDAIKTWGTKWEPDEVNFTLNGDQLELGFDTAWTPPKAFIKKAAEVYKSLTFSLYYLESGENFAGRELYKDGKRSLSVHLSNLVETFPLTKHPLFYLEGQWVANLSSILLLLNAM